MYVINLRAAKTSVYCKHQCFHTLRGQSGVHQLTYSSRRKTVISQSGCLLLSPLRSHICEIALSNRSSTSDKI